MKTTDTSEKGLEAIIVASLVNEAGYELGDPKDYDREHAIDLTKLLQFLKATQPELVESFGVDSMITRNVLSFYIVYRVKLQSVAWLMFCAVV